MNREACFISFAGYEGCIELSNANTRGVIEPNLSGRVLHYQLNGAIQNIFSENLKVNLKTIHAAMAATNANHEFKRR
jgi:hypothetical protein